MGRYWLWALLIGVIFHLLSFGGLFTHLVSALLTLALLVGGLALMLSRGKAVRPLGYAVVGAVALLVLPHAIADGIRGIWAWNPIPLALKLLIGVAAVVGLAAGVSAGLILRRRLPRSAGWSELPSPPFEPVRRPRGPRRRQD